jgi:hypothetical protein
MQKNTSYIFLFALCLLSALISLDDAKADLAGLSVDTSVIMLRMENKKEIPFSFTVKNQTSAPQQVHLEERDITIGNENEVTFVDAKDGPSSLVTFAQNDFLLAGGQAQKIMGTFALPDQQKNSIEMMTLVSFASQEVSPEGGPKVSGSIGVYTLLAGSSAQDAAGTIKEVNYTKFIKDNVDFSAVYENIGDVQFVPQAKISIASLLTRERVEIPLENHFVFPARKFTFAKKLDNVSAFGAYEIKVSFKDGNGKLLEKTVYTFGRFFPALLIFGLLIFGYFIKKLLELRQRNWKEVRVHGVFARRKR